MSARRRGSGAGTPKRLTADEVTDLTIEASFRDDSRPGKTNATLYALLKTKNWWRMHRLKSDFEWAQGVAKRNGYNPEEVRWLL